MPLRVACDVRNVLLGPRGAARVFGPQKGAGPAEVEELERRLAASERLAPFAGLPGAGAGGGLGAALAALGGELCEGAELVLDVIGFDAAAAGAALAVTGEGTVDQTTLEGKAPGAVMRRCRRLGVRCELFGGRVEDIPLEAHALSGDPGRAAEDLTWLGEELARRALRGCRPRVLGEYRASGGHLAGLRLGWSPGSTDGSRESASSTSWAQRPQNASTAASGSS